VADADAHRGAHLGEDPDRGAGGGKDDASIGLVGEEECSGVVEQRNGVLAADIAGFSIDVQRERIDLEE
jgi:hypothetical protein